MENAKKINLRRIPWMSSKTIPLTGSQINTLQSLADDPHTSPDFAKMGEVNPNLRVFVVNFDGTWNDRVKVPAGESATLVAKLYEETAAFNSATFESHYVNGVGTRTSKMRSLWEGATGDGCKARAEAMHDLLQETAKRWLEENPDAQIHVHTTGFSRGAASSLHFLNLVDEFGALSRSSDPDFLEAMAPTGIGPKQVKSSAMLFDVVATGQEDVLKLTVPTTTQSLLHLAAGSDERNHFKLVSLGDHRYDKVGKRIEGANNCEWAQAKNVSLPPERGPVNRAVNEDGSFFYQRIRQIELPGARHSDVGGSYSFGGIAGLPMYLARSFQSTLGMPGRTPIRPTFSHIQHASANDSRDALELSRQKFQSLGGQKFSRELVNRAQADQQTRLWGGDTLRSVTMTLRDEHGKVFAMKTSQSVVPHEEGKALPSDQKMGRPDWLVIDPNRVQKLNSRMLGGGKTIGTSTGDFEVDNDARTIHFKGVRIDDVGSQDSVVAPIMDGTKKHWLEVSVSSEKLYCPLQDGQQIDRQVKLPAPQFKYGGDPWSFPVVEAIRILNERTHANPADPRQFTPIDSVLASSLIGRSLESSAWVALDEHKVDAVSFKVAKQRGNGDKLRVSAIFEKDGVIEEYPFKGPAEATAGMDRHASTAWLARDVEEVVNLHRRVSIASLVSGVEEVVNLLKDAGHDYTGQSFKMDKNRAPYESAPLYVEAMLGGEESARKPKRMQPGR